MASTYAETTGTLTNTTVSIPANNNRHGIIIGNLSDTSMVFRVGGTASASAGILIPAESSVILTDQDAPAGAISLFCAGTSKAYCVYEW